MEAGNVSFISSISNVMHSPQLSLVWAMWYQWFYPSDSKYSIGGRLISTPFRFRDSNNFPLENSSRYTLCWFILSHWLSWWLSGKEFSNEFFHCRGFGFNPWVGKIPWRRKWQPIPIFLLGKPHGQRRLVSYGPWGCKESDVTYQLNHHHHHLLDEKSGFQNSDLGLQI